MPKLLIATTIPGTLLAFLLPYADHFRRLGWRVDALANGAAGCEGCVARFDRAWDATWSREPLAARNATEAPRQIRELVAREGYDVVHVHTPVAGFVTRLALRGLRRGGLKVVYTAHGFHFQDPFTLDRTAVFRALEHAAARWSDRLVVINRDDERAAARMIDPARIRYMPGIGLDLARYAPASAETRARWRATLGVGPGQPVLTAVAELIPRKRHEDLLRAFAALARPDAVLALAGSGPLEAALRAQAEALGIASQVRFLGWQADVEGLMGSSDAVLLVSAQEGLPRSVMEAMAVGVPVIATDIRGNRDLLAGGLGRLHPVGDWGAVAGAMREVLDGPADAAALAARARAAVVAYDVRLLLAQHEALYAELLAGG